MSDLFIPEQAVVDVLPQDGWIRQYVDYAAQSTDSPLAFQYATALTILSAAAAKVRAKVYSTTSDLDVDAEELNLTLWTMLIATSGDRKTFSMSLGVDLLTRASGDTPAVMPTDGSLEGWIEALSENPHSLLFRDELSYLFAQSERGYSQGIKEFLLSIHSGKDYTRKLKSKKDDETKGVSVIKSPRLSILGAMPPKVFETRTSRADWRSGFFARFMAVPATRERLFDYHRKQPKTEAQLARWLAQVPLKSRGLVKAARSANEPVFEWNKHSLEPLRSSVSDAAFSHITRYQTFAHQIAALIALSRAKEPLAQEKDYIVVTPADTECAVAWLKLCLPRVLYLTESLYAEPDRAVELKLREIMGEQSAKFWTVLELQKMLPDTAVKRIRGVLKDLAEVGQVLQQVGGIGKGPGRKQNAYRWIKEN